MKRGYIKLYRKIEDSGILGYDLKVTGFLAWLLLNVNWKANKWRSEWVCPGQKITSINNLSAEIFCTPKVTRRLLDVLEAEGILKREVRANKWTKLSVCNWAIYQDTPCMKGILKELKKTNRGNSKGQGQGSLKGNNQRREERNKAIINLYRDIAERYRDAYKKQYPKFAEEIDRNYNELSWCEEIDSLIRLDQHSRQDIIDVLMFALKDDFWSVQLRSLATLRKKGKNECKKFDNIKAKMLQIETCKPKLHQAERITDKVYKDDFS